MSFSAEEVAEEFAAFSHQRESLPVGFRYFARALEDRPVGKTKAERRKAEYARIKADPIRLENRRRIARESQARRAPVRAPLSEAAKEANRERSRIASRKRQREKVEARAAMGRALLALYWRSL